METKRSGFFTYLKQGDRLGVVTGPWNPGGAWKADVYQVEQPDFDKAWSNMEHCRSPHDRLNSLLHQPYEADCLGYKFPRKSDAMTATAEHLQGDMKDLASELRGRMSEAVQRLVS